MSSRFHGVQIAAREYMDRSLYQIVFISDLSRNAPSISCCRLRRRCKDDDDIGGMTLPANLAYVSFIYAYMLLSREILSAYI